MKMICQLLQLCVTLCVMLLLAKADIPYTPIIQYMTPNSGSLAGGTTVIIFGSGFSRMGQQGSFVGLPHVPRVLIALIAEQRFISVGRCAR